MIEFIQSKEVQTGLIHLLCFLIGVLITTFAYMFVETKPAKRVREQDEQIRQLERKIRAQKITLRALNEKYNKVLKESKENNRTL